MDKRSSKKVLVTKSWKKKGIYTNGIGEYAKVKHDNPKRDNMHTYLRQEDQLKLSNITFKKKKTAILAFFQ